MAEEVNKSSQVLNSLTQIRLANPNWTAEQQLDYYRFKQDVSDVAAQTDDSSQTIEDLEQRVTKNEQDIQDLDARVTQNESDIQDNADQIASDFEYLHGDENRSDDYDESAGYTKYDLVSFDGKEYSAKNDISSPAGPFNISLWRNVSTVGNNDYVNEHIDAADPHPQYKMKLGGWSLFGTVDNFIFNTTASKLVNYSDEDNWDGGGSAPLDATNGEITIPEDGLYRIVALLIGEQGNNTKEESMILEIDVNSTRFTISVFDVATDKTDLRSFNSVFTRRFLQDDVVSLYAVATADMGTFTVESTTFEVQRLE